MSYWDIIILFFYSFEFIYDLNEESCLKSYLKLQMRQVIATCNLVKICMDQFWWFFISRFFLQNFSEFFLNKSISTSDNKFLFYWITKLFSFYLMSKINFTNFIWGCVICSWFEHCTTRRYFQQAFKVEWTISLTNLTMSTMQSFKIYFLQHWMMSTSQFRSIVSIIL